MVADPKAGKSRRTSKKKKTSRKKARQQAASPVTEPAPPAAPESPEAAPATVSAEPARKKVLITGIGRNLGRILAKRLVRDYDIVGLGRRGWEGGRPKRVEAHAIELNRNRAEDFFRRDPLDAVVHMEYVHSPSLPADVRHRFNVVGTMKLLDYCHKYGVKKVVVLTTANIYGPLPDNHALITEDDPVRAPQDYVALRQVIEVDTYFRSWMWRFRETPSLLIRPCNILGPSVRNSMARFFARKNCLTLLGFDPMMQFIHEEDVAEGLALAIEAKEARGIFNLAGVGCVPLSVAIREAGGTPIPVPHPLMYALNRRLWKLGLSPFPSPELDYLRYSMIVSGEKARREMGFEPRFSIAETLRSVRMHRS